MSVPPTADEMREWDWRPAAEAGQLDQLRAWAAEAHHVDLADEQVLYACAANALVEAGWRNNTLMEDIHVGALAKRGQGKVGLSDAEMMAGAVTLAQIAQRHLRGGRSYWDLDLGDEWCALDRPFADGVPLLEHVSKANLTAHRKRVTSNLWRFRLIYDLVGVDRFLAGLALVGLEHAFWGTPMWGHQVQSWAQENPEAATSDLVAGLVADPSQVPLVGRELAVATGIGYAHGREQWHRDHCGDPDHAHQSPQDLVDFLGMAHHLTGAPSGWLAAAFAARTFG